MSQLVQKGYEKNYDIRIYKKLLASKKSNYELKRLKKVQKALNFTKNKNINEKKWIQKINKLYNC